MEKEGSERKGCDPCLADSGWSRSQRRMRSDLSRRDWPGRWVTGYSCALTVERCVREARKQRPKRFSFYARPLIRHAYEEALNRCARLALFATAKPTDVDGPVDARARKLAWDDLSTFAIHARRLVDISGTRKQFSKVTIRGVRNGMAQQLSLMEIVSAIVHSSAVEIARTDLEVHTLAARDPIAAFVAFKGKPRAISPQIAIIAGPHKSVSFSLIDLTRIFEAEILNPIIEICSDDMLFLEPDGIDD